MLVPEVNAVRPGRGRQYPQQSPHRPLRGEPLMPYQQPQPILRYTDSLIETELINNCRIRTGLINNYRIKTGLPNNRRNSHHRFRVDTNLSTGLLHAFLVASGGIAAPSALALLSRWRNNEDCTKASCPIEITLGNPAMIPTIVINQSSIRASDYQNQPEQYQNPRYQDQPSRYQDQSQYQRPEQDRPEYASKI